MTMDGDPCAQLTVDYAEGLVTVTLQRPEKLNAITRDMRVALAGAVARFRADYHLRVMLFRAQGAYFSSGMDITGMGGMPEGGIALRNDYRELHDLFDELERIEKPVVVAAQGPCLGGALELALSCDFRLASDRARFGLPEIRLGVLPGSGGTSRLTQLVGRGWARWMVMAGQEVTADRALSMGLVHAVYPHAEFDGAVDAFVRELLALSPEVVGLAKLSIELSSNLDRNAARNVERIANTILINGDEHHQAIARFRTRKSKASE